RLAVLITATVLAECARCLDPVERVFTAKRTFFIRDEEWAQDDPEGNNLPFTQDGKLDVKELAYTELVLEIPTVLLCSDDCAGLCPVCGHRQPCSCRCETNDTTDARLLILKQLLTD
ncbi:MAG: YceD family protein, partial [Ruthenibacterium sp.]